MRLNILYNDGREESFKGYDKSEIQPFLQKLAKSNVYGIDANDLAEGAKAFSQMLELNKSIQSLMFSDGARDIVRVCKGLEDHPSLETLIVERGHIDSNQIKAVATLLGSTIKLKTLFLKNYICDTEVDVRPLIDILPQCETLNKLSLELGGISKEVSRDLYESAVLKGKVVNLGLQSGPIIMCEFGTRDGKDDVDHYITDEVKAARQDPPLGGIIPAIKAGDGLISLDLPAAYLGDAGVRNLCAALLHHATIKSLGLCCNGIGPEVGTESIAQLLEANKSLRDLSLTGNKIGSGVAKIAAKLPHTGLTRITLSNNEIDDTGLASIAKAIELGAKIPYITLDSNKAITEEGVAVLRKAMSALQSVHQMYIAIPKFAYVPELRAHTSEHRDIELLSMEGVKAILQANRLKAENDLGWDRIKTELPKTIISEEGDYQEAVHMIAAELRAYVEAGMDVACLPEMLSTEKAWNSEAVRHDFAGSHGAIFEVVE